MEGVTLMRLASSFLFLPFCPCKSLTQRLKVERKLSMNFLSFALSFPYCHQFLVSHGTNGGT